MRFSILAALALAGALITGQSTSVAALADQSATATIQAQILGRTDAPFGDIAVQGATIEVKGLALRATTGAGGVASFVDVPVSGDPEEPTRVDILISAPGYASFTYRSVPIYPNNGPILTPVLKDTPQVDNLGVPVPPLRQEVAGEASPGGGTGFGEAAAGCSGYSATDTPPSIIRVYHNNPDHGADYLVHTVDFQSYVRHVLPQEWPHSWPTESLRVGAIAVKMYGWYWTINWRGGTAGGQCFDVTSSPDSYQAWDPNVEYPTTNQAVNDTWDYYLMYNSSGAPYETTYAAGPGDACGQDGGAPAPGNHLSQWGSKACADAGKVWYDILLNWYYFNPPSALKNGPHAVGSTVENLPLLVPLIEPYSNTQVKISWAGQSGVQYYRCSSTSYPGLFNSCTSIPGTGANSVTISISTAELATTYYRLRACKNGYCSAVNAGGYQYRNQSGNTFYATVGYVWPYASASVAARNTTTASHAMKLYDGVGVPGYGGTLKVTCSSVPAGGKCGPSSWFPGSQSWWYDTGSQTIGTELFAIVRLMPMGTGE